MKRLLHWHFTVCNSLLFIFRLYLSRRAAIYVLLASKAKKDDKPFLSTIHRPFGALEGTRIPGPLIKRAQGASFVKFKKFEETLFLSYHRKTRLCTHCIICIQCNALQPLSIYSGVQKCADGQNKAQWTNQSPVLWQGLGHPNRHHLI